MERSAERRQARTASQAAALAAIRAAAEKQRPEARSKLQRILGWANLSEELLIAATTSIQRSARVALHFHPDRVTNNGLSVAERMLADGVYRSQFETGVSNGSPTAFPGGDRDRWEARLFRGAYQAPGVSAAERPKYGSVQVFYYADGPSPRFGSCYFLLRPEVCARCTLTYGDSHTGPGDVGTIDALDSIMAALLDDIEKRGSALGTTGLTVRGFLDYLIHEFPAVPGDWSRLPIGRNLDEYIEAQVHGTIFLERDVERLIVDPSYQGSETGAHLREIGAKYGIALEQHPGFCLAVEDVPVDFRGRDMPSFARWVAHIAGTDKLDAATIGIAAASLHCEPDSWRRWGACEDSLRLLRQIWHVLVKFGVPSCWCVRDGL